MNGPLCVSMHGDLALPIEVQRHNRASVFKFAKLHVAFSTVAGPAINWHKSIPIIILGLMLAMDVLMGWKYCPVGSTVELIVHMVQGGGLCLCSKTLGCMTMMLMVLILASTVPERGHDLYCLLGASKVQG